MLLNLEYISLIGEDDEEDGALTIEDNIDVLILCALAGATLSRRAKSDDSGIILQVKLIMD